MSTAKVSRRSVSDQVSDAIRNMILVGELAPDQRITHDDLAARLDVSTMPIREALVRLSYEGLIDAKPNRSFRVAGSTRADITDIYWMHGILAGELTARACKKGGTALIKELTDIQDEWSGDQAIGLDRMQELNHRFHRVINRAADSPKLLLMLRNTMRFIPEDFYVLLPSWSEISLRGHQAIIDAISAGDAKQASTLAAKHVHEAGELLTEFFDTRGYWNQPPT